MNIQYFLNNNFDTYEDCLSFYINNICEHLLTTDPDTIISVKNKLCEGIRGYAQQYSLVYAKINDIYTRHELDNKDLWVCQNISKDRIANQQTSGSTSGNPFRFYNDKKHIHNIQKKAEFNLILKEYELENKPLKILNLFKHPYNPTPKDFVLETRNHSSHPFHCYGAKESQTFFVNWNNYIENPEQWHDIFLEFLANHYFDIVLCSGPVINILTRYIKKYNFNHKFAYLLSHTTEFPRINDFEFLKQNNNIVYYCDHMRCWDGGATFFTCKYKTYHLLDNFSWVTQGEDNKMICTDYFNLTAPFINYWNGDKCQIINEYQKCKCGRYYRPFKMLQNRPFALKGPTKLTIIKEQISELSFKSSIDQIQFEGLEANIYLNGKIDDIGVNKITEILKDYTVKFYGI